MEERNTGLEDTYKFRFETGAKTKSDIKTGIKIYASPALLR